MFIISACGLVTAFAALATSALAQGHTSEQSEAQITGLPYAFAPGLLFPR
jgi:hypothetical protein